jgi:hypothetical protein
MTIPPQGKTLSYSATAWRPATVISNHVTAIRPRSPRQRQSVQPHQLRKASNCQREDPHREYRTSGIT